MSDAAVDRQTMEVDIVCVGFGPGTAGFLTTLAKYPRSGAPGGLLRARRRHRLRRLRRRHPRPRHPRHPSRSRPRPHPHGRPGRRGEGRLPPRSRRRQPPLLPLLRAGDRLVKRSACIATHAVELPYIPPFLHKAGRPRHVARPVHAVGRVGADGRGHHDLARLARGEGAHRRRPRLRHPSLRSGRRSRRQARCRLHARNGYSRGPDRGRRWAGRRRGAAAR